MHRRASRDMHRRASRTGCAPTEVLWGVHQSFSVAVTSALRLPANQASHGCAISASIRLTSIAHRPTAPPSTLIQPISDSSANTPPAVRAARGWPRSADHMQCGEAAYHAVAEHAASAKASRLIMPCALPAVTRAGGDRALVAVVAPRGAVAGGDVFLVGEVADVQLQSPASGVVVHGGVEQGVGRRLPVIVD